MRYIDLSILFFKVLEDRKNDPRCGGDDPDEVTLAGLFLEGDKADDSCKYDARGGNDRELQGGIHGFGAVQTEDVAGAV